MTRLWDLVATALLVVAMATEQGSTSLPERVTVGTTDGRISGIKKTTVKGREFYGFWSIPYAKPRGSSEAEVHLIFQDPVASDGWEGVRDGSVESPLCSQIGWFELTSRNYTHDGSEDCLYLNIFTHKPGHLDANLPVLVYIHGGGFFAEGAEIYPPTVIMDRDVVFVTLQYRLGILGFLSTEDSVIPGNFGLKDQTMALRWIQNNIRRFGGDPQRVTLIGTSAGGASVHYHYISPYSRDLFARGIMMSGSLFNPWAMGAAYKEVAEFTGRLFGCEERRGISSGEASRALLDCLQKVDAQDLTLSLRHHITFNYNPALLGPRVDGDYIPVDPELLMSQGWHKHADLIAGITQHEGGLFGYPLYEDEYLRKVLVENFEQFGPESLDLTRGDEKPQQLAAKVFQHYVGGVRVDEEVADQLCELFGERHINLGVEWVARLHARNTQPEGRRTYLYNVTYQGERSSKDFYNHNVGKHWVSHGDDLFFLFEGSIWGSMMREEDLLMREKMLDLWVNFAATGNPTPDSSLGFVWEAVTPDNLRYLNLKLDPVMEPDTRHKVREFWESLPTKQNKLLNPDKVIFSTDASPGQPIKSGQTHSKDLPPKPLKYQHGEL